ncbi:MAG TPA: efflux RND transporter periplasmic adaptor subunit [Aestuariivirgaceae bacterium]|nr:efflux RND transporter periplasmic adaptor subunit [Aestuariivirgaceae bacterium]
MNSLGANNRVRSAILTAVALPAAVAAWLLISRAEAEKESNRSDNVIEIVSDDIEEVVTAQGKLEPKNYVDVGAQVSGQLKTVRVAIGDNIKEGDLIAEIDPQIYEARLAANEARLRTLEAQRVEQQVIADQAQQMRGRNEKLQKSGAVSKQAFEDAETALKIASAKLAAVEAQIDESRSTIEGDKASLNYTRIFAPMSGTVVLQGVRAGQTLNASQSAPMIVQLADLDTMTVRAQVAEADIMRIKAGMPVYFKTLGSRERRWQGKVRQLLPSPEVINDVVLYNVLVDVDNADRQLMSGMSTQMFFIVGKAMNVPVLPTAALMRRAPRQDSEKGEAYQVRVADGEGSSERIVHVGLMDRSKAEIRAGLSLGDRIILPQPQQQNDRASGGGRRTPRL